MTTPNNDLRSLIDAAAAKPGSPKPSPVRTVSPTGPAPTTTAPGDDIRALVQQATGGAEQTAAVRVPLAARKESDAHGALSQAIWSTKSGQSHVLPSAALRSGDGRSNCPTDLSHAVQQAKADGDTPTAASGKPSVFKNPTVIASMVALAMLILALGWWKLSRPALNGPPATLQLLAKSIEQYRHLRNNSLPEQLSNLEHFPKDAVEWQLRHWKARDARGRTEIFWAPNGPKHYRIVLRQGSAVWVYNDLDGKSKQTQP